MSRSRVLVAMSVIILSTSSVAWAADQEKEDSVFIDQAAGETDTRGPSSVFGSQMPQTDQDLIVSRGQGNAGTDEKRPFEQITASELDLAAIGQLSSDEVAILLAQLDDAERQVLIEKVRGTDICESTQQSEPIRMLCSNRIETRSSEFAQAPRNQLSPEERLLGEGLDGTPSQSIEGAIRRLARDAGASDEFANQAIASVALSANPPVNAEAPSDNGSGADGLSAETQALINAIVERFGGPGGGGA